MPVQGVNHTDTARAGQVRIEQQAEEGRNVEQRRQEDNDREAQNVRRATETGRGEKVDLTA